MIRRIFIVLTGVCLANPALADDPFRITVHTTTGEPASVTASAPSLIDLANDVIKNQAEFTVLENRDFSGTFLYTTPRAPINFSANAAGTTGVLNIPSIHFTKTFTAANRDELENQIEDFIKTQGARVWARFLRKVDQTSLISVSDGNPRATTAFLATQSFNRLALTPAQSVGPRAKSNNEEFRLDFAGGSINTDDGNGYFASAVLSTGYRFTDNVALFFAIPFQYRSIQGAQIFDVAVELGLPITLVRSDSQRYAPAEPSFSWTLTPYGFVDGSGSEDFVAGGLMYGGGIASNLNIPLGPFTLTIGNAISFYEGDKVKAQGYEFDNNVSQQVLKNGLLLSWAPGRGNLVLDAGITYTNFLSDAALSDYWTPTAGVTLLFGPASGLRFAYAGDFGNGFTSHGGSIELFVNY